MKLTSISHFITLTKLEYISVSFTKYMSTLNKYSVPGSTFHSKHSNCSWAFSGFSGKGLLKMKLVISTSDFTFARRHNCILTQELVILLWNSEKDLLGDQDQSDLFYPAFIKTSVLFYLVCVLNSLSYSMVLGTLFLFSVGYIWKLTDSLWELSDPRPVLSFGQVYRCPGNHFQEET